MRTHLRVTLLAIGMSIVAPVVAYADETRQPPVGPPPQVPTLDEWWPCPPDAPPLVRPPRLGQPPRNVPYRPPGSTEFTIEGASTDIKDMDGPLGVLGGHVPLYDWGLADYKGHLDLRGFRATVNHWVNNVDRLELRVSYTEFSATSRQNGFNLTWAEVVPPHQGQPGGIFLAGQPRSRATLVNDSALISGELNWWRHPFRRGPWRMNAGPGLRYINLDERASVEDWTIPARPADTPYLRSDVENTFIGAQVVGSIHYDLGRRFTFGVTGKAMGGMMERDLRVQDFDVVVYPPLLPLGILQVSADSAWEPTWGLEAEVTGRYHLNSCVSITVSYNVLYLDEVVRAHDAMNFVIPAGTFKVLTKQDTSSFVVQSIYVGISVTW